MLALKSMASGPPVDMQREARWPSLDTQVNPRGTKGVSVDWESHQIESDYDDMEGIFPRRPGGPVGQGGPEGAAADGDGDDSAWL